MKKLMMMVVIVLTVVNVSSADVIRGIDIDFVTIGNAGNVGEQSRLAEYGDITYYGGVNYEYQIGKYEVTNAQWNAFVSAAGAPTGNPSDAYDESAYWTGTNEPANAVSWYEAAQFCNYLTSGDKYLGAYNFDQSGNFLGIDRDSAVSAYNGIAYVIPTEDEWYKAAYYTGSGYSTYANGLDIILVADIWNYTGGTAWAVGSGTEEQNETFDMMGNMQELTETPFGSNRRIRGGSVNGGELRSSERNYVAPSSESNILGFRVASVPEPASLILLSLSAVVLRIKRN